MFPVRAVTGPLPVGGDDLAMLAEGTVEALGKPRKVSPYRPDPAAERHPIDSGNTTVIVVKHPIDPSLIVRTDDRDAARKVAGGNLRMLYEEGSTLQPGERAMPAYYGGRVLVKGHRRDF